MSSISQEEFDALNVNGQTNAAQQQSFVDTLQEIQDAAFEDRFGLPVAARLSLFGLGAGIIGGVGGMVHGWSQASLRYLAANAHRLPKSYNGWFFYHKRKSYYCAKSAMALAFTTGMRLASFVVGIFALEAGLDWARDGQRDWANTAMAVSLPGFGYAWIKGMNRVQARELIHKGGRIGIGLGLAQDLLQFVRGADVWYLREWFGIKPMKLRDRIYPNGPEGKPEGKTVKSTA